MTKNILELGIYIAIITLLLGLVALINTMVTNTGSMSSQSMDRGSYEYLQN